jgi:translation initiation factor IF-3
LRRSRKKQPQKKFESRVKINQYIRAEELRVIDEEGETFGVLSTKDALEKAKGMDLDLIEISPNAKPPVAKIMDFGKFQYGEKKKAKAAKAKVKNVEVKSIQVKVGTGDGDLNLKANKASKWLNEGHRIKVELFLPGRTKYMERDFLEERLQRVLKLITVDFTFAQEIKKVPKGIHVIIEKK